MTKMRDKERVLWTKEEEQKVFDTAVVLQKHNGTGVGTCALLQAAQRSVLSDNRWLADAPLYPSGRRGKNFLAYLNSDEKYPKNLEIDFKTTVKPAEKAVKYTEIQEKLTDSAPDWDDSGPTPPVDWPTPAPKNEDFGVILAQKLTEIADLLAQKIINLTTESIKNTLDSTISSLRNERKTPVTGVQTALKVPEKPKKVLVLGPKMSKLEEFRKKYSGKLDIRMIDVDDIMRLRQITKTWRDDTVVMVNLISHSVMDLVKDTTLWRVNSFDECFYVLDELAGEQK